MKYHSHSLWPVVCLALILSVCLAGCSDSEEEKAPAPEQVTPTLTEEQLISALEEISDQPLRQREPNARYGFRLPYTTYQVVVLISRLSGEFSILRAAVESADLADALNGSDPLTVFAPTNAAFARLGLDEDGVKKLDTEALVNILTYHVTPGDRFLDDLLKERTIEMLNGGTAEVTRQGKSIFINEARLLAPFLVNLPTRNGVIHIINEVLDPADSPMAMPPLVKGLAYAPASNATEAANALNQTLEDNPNIGVVARVDHAANAASVGQELRSTEVILFGNPKLGTPLMQINQTIGIDLPQKVLFYENEAGEAYAAYNTPAYLASRHHIPADSATLPMIGMALRGLVEDATGSAVVLPDSAEVAPFAGLVVATSSYDAETTYRRLVDAVEAVDPLRIIAEVDHAANAERVGLELRPTKLLIFGNPNLGTPLMQARQTVGIDLPQKMLVWQGADGQVYLAYNDPYYLAKRHGIPADQEQLATIDGALEGLAQQATE